MKLGKAIRRLGRRIRTRRLSDTARRVKKEHLTFLSLERLLALEQEATAAITRCGKGDILEFGVALGGSSIVLANIASSRHPYHGFDVFGLIPQPTSTKDDERSKARYVVISSGQAEGIKGDGYYGYREDLYDHVCKELAKYGLPVDGEKITLHKGLFEDTWASYKGTAVAFAHIDCDWYDPTRFCLEKISSKIVSGGVVVVDDYNDYGGSKIAVDEFLKENRGSWVTQKGPNMVMRKI